MHDVEMTRRQFTYSTYCSSRFRIGFPVMLLTTAIASLWLLFCHVWLQWNT